ncbi:MAG: carbohydrate ABC transporter permease [Oscillospiraceae bacterium]|jgi:ABC-type glycerol-3-phosphate transport system permease component|nr:carbohydrate ABC transporter permease [Oscillospiraceae bacterium]
MAKFKIGKRKKYSGSVGGDIMIFLLLAIVGVFMLFPIYLSVVQSLKPREEFFLFPPRLYPIRPTTQNYTELFQVAGNMWVPFSRYLFNSVFVTVVITVSQLMFASSAAYVLAKVRAPGIKILNKIIEISLLFQSTVTFVMVYLVMAKLGMINTYFAITLPFIATPLSLFFMRQFMGQIHDSMIEAAQLDGAGHMRICWQVVMPNVKPAWITLIIFAFNGAWQMTGYSFIYNEALKPIPTVMEQIKLSGIQRMGIAAAASVFIMVPPMTIFVFCQSNVIETMAQSGLKD